MNRIIHTGYFGRVKAYRKEGLEPISIARWSPDWYKGRSLPELAPSSSLMQAYRKGGMSKDRYEDIYLSELDRLDPQEIVEKIGENAVLLCYETYKRYGEWCHRHMAAKWLEENANVTCMEVP